MDIPVIDFDGATRLDLKGMYAGRKWATIVLEHFEDDGVTPIIQTSDYEFRVSKDVNETDLRLVDEVQNDEHKMIIDISQNENILKTGQYYYTVTNDEEPFPKYYGLLSINHKKGQWP